MRLVPIIIVLLVLSAIGWTGKFLYDKSQPPPKVVQTETVIQADIVKKTVATGAIVPRKEIEIKPRASGILSKLLVEPGKRVEKGDQLAQIEIVPDMASLQRAQSDVQQARISFGSAKRELERHRQMREQQLITQTELNRFQLDYDLNRQGLAAARENLQLVREGASRAARKAGVATNEVRTTVAGMVLQVPEKVGASVIESNNFNPGTTVAVVADMSDMIFEGWVDESEVGKLKEGMKLDVRIGALQDKPFVANLEYIAPKGIEADGAIQFEIRAAMALQEDAFVRAGYSANADIVLDRRAKVTAVNEAAVQKQADEYFVERKLADGSYEHHVIQLGLSDGINVEVLEGLEPGDVVKKPDPAEGGPAKKK